MRTKVLFAALLLFAVCVGHAQLQVTTESGYNFYKHYTAATVANGDTIVNLVGAQTPPLVGPYIVAVIVNTSAASSSFTILDGSNVVAVVTLPATAITTPIVVPYNIRLRTSLVFKLVANSDVTVVYRTWRTQ